MAKNFYFENFTNSMEQELIEDLVIESIRIYGVETYYIPRTLLNKDDLLNEATESEFRSAVAVEMYVKNVDGFEGEGDFLSKFGLQIRDSMTLTVAIKVFQEETSNLSTYRDGFEVRPREGDVIYFPLNNKLFEVQHVEHEAIFYQMGSLQTFDLRCELFEHSGEVFKTGVYEIDSRYNDYNNWRTDEDQIFNVKLINDPEFTLPVLRVISTQGVPIVSGVGDMEASKQSITGRAGVKYVFDVSDASMSGIGLQIYDEGGQQETQETFVLIGVAGTSGAYYRWIPSEAKTYYYDVDPAYDNHSAGSTIIISADPTVAIEEYDVTADNETIESIADNILDFSEDNPFGEDQY